MRWFFLSLTFMTLAACSAAPSETAIQTAITQTSVAQETVQVTSPPTVSDVTPSAITVMAQSATNIPGSEDQVFVLNDLPRLNLQPNEVAAPLTHILFYKTSDTASGYLYGYSGISKRDEIPSLNVRGTEARAFTSDQKVGAGSTISTIYLFKDSTGASRALKLMSEKLKDPQYHEVNSAGLGGESFGVSNGSVYQYRWRVANAVFELYAEGPFQEQEVRALADKMQAHVKLATAQSPTIPTPNEKRLLTIHDIWMFVLQGNDLPSDVYQFDIDTKVDEMIQMFPMDQRDQIAALNPQARAQTAYLYSQGKGQYGSNNAHQIMSFAFLFSDPAAAIALQVCFWKSCERKCLKTRRFHTGDSS